MVAKARNLPPVSLAAIHLVGLLDQPDTSTEEVVRVVKTDNVLTAKLLRTCNSPMLGLQEEVSSLDQAVLILGYREISQMVMRLAFGPAMAVALPSYACDANHLWAHGLMAACGAESLVQRRPELEVDSSLAYTVGLLHDIGKLVISSLLTRDQQLAIRHRLEAGVTSVIAERELLGVDHAEVGACLSVIWHLPETLVEAVANHHFLEARTGWSPQSVSFPKGWLWQLSVLATPHRKQRGCLRLFQSAKETTKYVWRPLWRPERSRVGRDFFDGISKHASLGSAGS